jgi:hypothetical protein
MNTLETIHRWLAAGKQIGKTISFDKGAETCWLSVAVQKHEDVYKLYLDEIAESQMAAHEDYDTELVRTASTLQELPALMELITTIKLEELAPLKGQKIFNPVFC